MQTVGFIGLGSMGAGMARNLRRAGFTVRAYDIEPRAVAAAVAEGAAAARSPADAGHGADLLAVCVFDAAQAEAALFGTDGATGTLPSGATVLMHTTVSADAARALEARLAWSGHALLDAPLTGGQAGAESGTLTIIASGPGHAFAAATAALEAMGKRIYRVGETVGAASTVKMINQLLVGVHTVAAAEAIALAAKAGADPKLVYEVITHGAGNSVSWKTRIPFILDEDFAPRGVVEILIKDLEIVSAAAAKLGTEIPLAEAALAQYRAAAALGFGKLDAAAVVKVYEARAETNVAAAARRRRGAGDSTL